VGPGLDGDEAVDVSGRTLLPGMFDCHTHVVMDHFDYLRLLTEPFSLQFFYAVKALRRRSTSASRRCGTPGARTPE